MQEINFTRNLDRTGSATILFIIAEVQETILLFSQETMRIL